MISKWDFILGMHNVKSVPGTKLFWRIRNQSCNHATMCVWCHTEKYSYLPVVSKPWGKLLVHFFLFFDIPLFFLTCRFPLSSFILLAMIFSIGKGGSPRWTIYWWRTHKRHCCVFLGHPVVCAFCLRSPHTVLAKLFSLKIRTTLTPLWIFCHAIAWMRLVPRPPSGWIVFFHQHSFQCAFFGRFFLVGLNGIFFRVIL